MRLYKTCFDPKCLVDDVPSESMRQAFHDLYVILLPELQMTFWPPPEWQVGPTMPLQPPLGQYERLCEHCREVWSEEVALANRCENDRCIVHVRAYTVSPVMILCPCARTDLLTGLPTCVQVLIQSFITDTRFKVSPAKLEAHERNLRPGDEAVYTMRIHGKSRKRLVRVVEAELVPDHAAFCPACMLTGGFRRGAGMPCERTFVPVAIA